VRETPKLLCGAFQRELSALFDGELPESHARKTLAHLEACGDCSEFFQAVRLQALAHRDMSVPGSLARRLRRMPGQDMFQGMSDSEIVRRLAKALYELGKAYTLAGTDGEYLMRVAEEPVQIDDFRSGEAAQAVVAAEESGAARLASTDVLETDADDFLAKARTLLGEALRLKPRFAEARLYLGFLCQAQEDQDGAAAEYREVFLHTDRLANRAHAAIQLGMLYDHSGEHDRALRMYRWVVASGLLHRDPQFAFVLYNIAVEHISLGDLDDALTMLRRIRADHPGLWATVKEWLHRSQALLERLRKDDASRAALEDMEPAFFAA
jgi:tetratricopeptide (TPR) repeat protein